MKVPSITSLALPTTMLSAYRDANTIAICTGNGCPLAKSCPRAVNPGLTKPGQDWAINPGRLAGEDCLIHGKARSADGRSGETQC